MPGRMRLVAAFLVLAAVLAPARAHALQAASDPGSAASESAKIPAVVGSIVSSIRILNDFFQAEKEAAKRTLLVRRFGVVSDHLNLLIASLGNLREGLSVPEPDQERARRSVRVIRDQLSQIATLLDGAARDLGVEDRPDVVAAQDEIRSILQQRGELLASIASDLDPARSGSEIDLQTIRANAEQAQRLAQDARREIAEFLQALQGGGP